MKNELTDTNAEEETGQKTVTNNEQQCECCLLFIFSICLSSSGLFLVYTAFFFFFFFFFVFFFFFFFFFFIRVLFIGAYVFLVGCRVFWQPVLLRDSQTLPRIWTPEWGIHPRIYMGQLLQSNLLCVISPWLETSLTLGDKNTRLPQDPHVWNGPLWTGARARRLGGGGRGGVGRSGYNLCANAWTLGQGGRLDFVPWISCRSPRSHVPPYCCH